MTVYNSIEEAVKDTNAAINEIAKLQAENVKLQAENVKLQAENAKLQAEVELQSDSADH